MKRPQFLGKYNFSWEVFDVVIGGKSALDAHSYLTPMTTLQDVEGFLKSYGFDHNEPIQKAELFGHYQEALQFIRRYFLKEGNPEGLPIEIPPIFTELIDTGELLMMATGHGKCQSWEERLWAGCILKVMHTILHTDKDLRYNYFSSIQQQIFDKFYKFLSRDESDNLYLGLQADENKIPLKGFETKAKKKRDSVIIKLLHKEENVAQELFDRIGVRIVTTSRIDTLRVVKFLHENHIVLAHNIKPSRSHNTLVNLGQIKSQYKKLLRDCLRNGYTEKKFINELNKIMKAYPVESNKAENAENAERVESNIHSMGNYRAIQFTCRQMIIYKNPLAREMEQLKMAAKEWKEDHPLAERILAVNTSLLSQEMRFFYPYEIQIVDEESYRENTEGEASHKMYKKAQLQSAMQRVFKSLIEFLNLDMDLTS